MDTTTNATDMDHAGDLLSLSREEMEVLVSLLHATLTAQSKDDANSDRCQIFTRVLRLSHDLYGTPAPSRETCICFG